MSITSDAALALADGQSVDKLSLRQLFAEIDSQLSGSGSGVSPGDLNNLSAQVDALSQRLRTLTSNAAPDSTTPLTPLNAAYLLGRPGDAPQAFTVDLDAGTSSLPPGSTIVNSATGRQLSVAGQVIVGGFSLVAIEPGRLYRARAVMSRAVDTADPAGSGVRFALAWYGQDGSRSPLVTSVADAALVVADGRQELSALVSATPGAFLDASHGRSVGSLKPPAGAVYARPYVQTYASDQALRLEVLELVDVTNGTVLSVNVDAFASRLSAIETILGIQA